MKPIDLAKRRRVMERSIALGHCICNARQPCPCDIFRAQDRCPCAGERPEPLEAAQVKLTQWVQNAGCASKIAPADLEAVLQRLPPVRDPAVLSGLAAADDAAIYRISDDLCLVQTVDVFTPCVDDPYHFGRICAANCLSDIYAMGGEPRTALSILGFPSEKLDGAIMFQMLAGAMETLGAAGVSLIGGHSIKEDEIKLGFAITGTIDPAVAAALDRPQAGDVLVLTKPLGTGVLAFAHQIGRAPAAGLEAAAVAMAALNQPAAEVMREAGASACTDITGFGLFGHLARLVRSANLTAEIHASALPAFPGVIEALRAGIIPGATERNREFVGAALALDPGVDAAWIHLGFDAQTSGGLLIALPKARLGLLMAGLRQRGVAAHCIGRLAPQTVKPSPGPARVEPPACEDQRTSGGGPCLIRVLANAEPDLSDPASSPPPPPAARRAGASGASFPDSNRASDRGAVSPELRPAHLPAAEAPPSVTDPAPAPPGCCCEAAVPVTSASTAGESQRAFAAFLRSVQAAGALEEKTKELILFSLVLQSRCGPCFDAHWARAAELGLTPEELDEAAWCAIALGGAPVRMFYRDKLCALKTGTRAQGGA